MDLDKKKPGGGAGGGDGGHEDFRNVNGNFERSANTIFLWTHPEDPSGKIGIIALGGGGRLSLEGAHRVSLRTKPPSPADAGVMRVEQPGILIFAHDEGDQILIQRGEVPGSSQYIDFEAGKIHIDAGQSGQILLSAGSSSILISPAGITMKGPLIQIN
jgi:hypothetical protein